MKRLTPSFRLLLLLLLGAIGCSSGLDDSQEPGAGDGDSTGGVDSGETGGSQTIGEDCALDGSCATGGDANSPDPTATGGASDSGSGGMVSTGTGGDDSTDPPVIPEDQCDTTEECVALFGASATDCVDSQSESSVCQCGAAPCDEGGTDPDPDPDPIDNNLLYENPLSSAGDVNEIKSSLESDQTDGLVNLQSGGLCDRGTSCMSVLHDYDGQNIKTAKVNGEYAMGARATEATFIYRVRFEDGFEFRKQGKLPGLIPTSPHFGGNKNDPPHPQKWSARVMWLKTGDADGNGEVKPDLYLYDQDRQQGQTGEHNNRAGYSFATNTWHTVVLYVKLNSSGGSRDGRAELWVNDELISCRTNKQFRGETGQATEIQRIAFHNYFGGGADYDWPHNPQYSYFDDLEVYEGRVTPFVPGASDCDDSIRNQ